MSANPVGKAASTAFPEAAAALFVGLATFDLAQQVSSLPRSNQKSVARAQFVAAGGPATNAAVTCARLLAGNHPALTPHPDGSQQPATALWPRENRCANTTTNATVLLTATGNGPLAAAMQADIQQQGVVLRDCTQLPANASTTAAHSAPTTTLMPAVSTIFVEPNGNRAISSMNAKLPVDTHLLETYLGELEARTTRVLLTDGYYPQLALPTLQWAQTHAPDAARILDGGSWKEQLPQLLPHLDIAIISADFLPPQAEDFASTCAVLRSYGVSHIIQTNGANPVRYQWAERHGSVPIAAATSVVDTLGAGDIFHGAFAAALARGDTPWRERDVEQLIRAAAAIASASVAHFGTRF